MEQKTEALYLINGDRFLHLRENGAGVGFATYDYANGAPLESGQISKQNLPPDGRNAIPAARNWYLFELSSDDRKAIQEVSLQHLDTISQSGVRRRRIWDDPTIPRDDVRLINSHYDDLYRVLNHGVIQVDRSDGSSYTARVEHLDDYHFDLGEYGNVYHICQFGEMMERTGSAAYPEIQTQDEQGAWELGGKGYLAIQSCEDGWDYTLYHSDYSVMDGGQIDTPELTIQEVREQILEAHHMEKGRRVLKDYDLIMDKVAEADELSLSGKPSTLEKLAALAKCDAPECNPTVCGKRGMPMNFDHEELMLMMLYNTGSRLGLMQELRLMQCYLMPDETALRELSEGVIEKLKLMTDAQFAEVEFPMD